MLNKKLLLVCLVCVNLLQAQIPVGLKHDLDGNYFRGYCDEQFYNPKNKLVHCSKAKPFDRGYYIDTTGESINGLIRYVGNSILFKMRQSDEPLEVKVSMVKFATMGNDSFFTITDRRVQKKHSKKLLVQHVATLDEFVFAKWYIVPVTASISPVAAKMNLLTLFDEGGDREPAVHYFFSYRDSSNWTSFDDKKNFVTLATRCFAADPVMINRIQNGRYNPSDMQSMVKNLQYYRKLQNGDRLYFDSNWQEIPDSAGAAYWGKIISRKDTLWTVDYFQDTTRIYRSRYARIFPHEREGEQLCFFKNGHVREVLTYQHNRLVERKFFDSNGVFRMQRSFQQMDNGRKKANGEWVYLHVADSTGKNVLTDTFSTVQDRDPLTGQIYTSVFHKNQPVAFYRLRGNDTIYQPLEPEFNENVSALQQKLTALMNDKEFEDAWQVNANGRILVSVTIAPDGKVAEMSVLNGIHPVLDTAAVRFLNKKIKRGTEYSFRFNPYRIHNTKHFAEFVVPIEFTSPTFDQRYENLMFPQFWMMMINSPANLGWMQTTSYMQWNTMMMRPIGF